MNADNFEVSHYLYDYEFRTIVDFIGNCHDRMLVKYSTEKIENNENKIRNRLFKDFLNSDIVKSDLDLFPCRFECESAEIDDSYNEVGYTDIKVLTSNSLIKSDAYFVIECKRLDGGSHLNKEYIENGIIRFLDGKKYPSFYNLSGMIGFIVRPINIEENIKKINGILLKNTKIKSKSLLVNEPTAQFKNFLSQHEKHDLSNLVIHHIMIDLSSIVS